MAVQLARTWSLVVIQAELDDAGATVTVRVVVNQRGQRTVRLETHLPVTEFLLPRDSAPRRFTLPQEVADLVAGWAATHTEDDTVLWLHLVKPYGLLGGVPWELLQSATGRRLLRLPDVLPTPRRAHAGDLHLAVCASSPDGDPIATLDGIQNFRGNLYGLSGTSVTVHYFCDPELSSGIGGGWAGARQVVHPVPSWLVRSGATPDPWLSWLVDAARTQVFDVIHLLGHARMGGYDDEGELLLAGSIQGGRDVGPSILRAEDLLALCTRTGAHGLGLLPLPDNPSLDVMRLLADAVGSRRAGPTFLSAAASSLGHSVGLDDAYRLMFPHHVGGRPSRLGADPPMLQYAQPAQVLDALRSSATAEDLAIAADHLTPGQVLELVRSSHAAPMEFPGVASAPPPSAAPAQPQPAPPAGAPPAAPQAPPAGAPPAAYPAPPAAAPQPWVGVLAGYVAERRAELGRLRSRDPSAADAAYVRGLEEGIRALDAVLQQQPGGQR